MSSTLIDYTRSAVGHFNHSVTDNIEQIPSENLLRAKMALSGNPQEEMPVESAIASETPSTTTDSHTAVNVAAFVQSAVSPQGGDLVTELGEGEVLQILMGNAPILLATTGEQGPASGHAGPAGRMYLRSRPGSRFHPYVRIDLGVTDGLPVPPMSKYAAARYFQTGSHLPPSDGAPPTPTVTLVELNEPIPAAYRAFVRRFKVLEPGYIAWVDRWARKIFNTAKFCESSKNHFLREISLLPTSKADQWNAQRDIKRTMALRRLAEIIYAALREIRDNAQEVKDIKEKKEMKKIEERYVSIKEISRKAAREYLSQVSVEREMAEVLTPEVDPVDAWRANWADWYGTKEFCRLLMDPYADAIREYWSPIVELHLGIPLAALGDPAMLSA